MSQPPIEGACLCGAVQLTVARPPRQVTQCNCSRCRRYGALWAYYRRKAVTIAAPRGGLARYATRPKTIRFVRCQTCGCVICWEEPGASPDDRLGINARLLDHARLADVPIKLLDGDKTWRALETYTKPGLWISPHRAPAAKRPKARQRG